MSRVTKNPEERKMEIVYTAKKLFKEKGFQNTSIVDITKEIDIAKGTFYYYFKSKEDVLDAVVETLIEKDLGFIKEIKLNKNINAKEKIREIRKILSERYRKYYGFLEKSEMLTNVEVRLRWLMKSFESKTPIVSEIIKEGVDNKEFNTDYPLEMAEIALVTAMFLMDPSLFTCTKDAYIRRLENLEIVLENGLGVEKGELAFISEEL